MKVKILVRPTGALNGEAWPAVGEEVDLPDVVAEGMVKSGNVEKAKAAAKKAEAKPDEAEKRPAARKGVETRAS